MPQVRLIKNPFDKKNDILSIDYGTNLQQVADNIDLPDSIRKHLVVYKLDENLDNPVLIPQEEWANTFPKDGEHYQLFSSFKGRGSGKQVTRMVAMVAIAIVAAYAAAALAAYAGAAAVNAGVGASMTTAGGTTFFGGAAIASAVGYGVGYVATMAAGMALLNALVPLPEQKTTASESSRTLTNSTNQANPYYPIPRVYGRTRFSPYKVAPDYTEQVGDDTYLRCLFCFGYGPLKISEIKIGDNPIENYEDVEYEIREGWDTDPDVTLYTNQVVTQPYAIALGAPKSQDIVTRDMVDEAIIQLAFTGLYRIRPNSKTQRSDTASFVISYRADGEEDWTIHSRPSWTAQETSPFVKTIRIKFPKNGTYQIRVQQTKGSTDNEYNFSEGMLQAVQNIRYLYPVRKKGLCLLAMRIKATDQLSGTLDGVSALCESYERTFSDKHQEVGITSSSANKHLWTLNTAGPISTWRNQDKMSKLTLTISFPEGVVPATNVPQDIIEQNVRTVVKYQWSGVTVSGQLIEAEKTYDSGWVNTSEIPDIVEEIWNNEEDPLLDITIKAQKTFQERNYRHYKHVHFPIGGWRKREVTNQDGTGCNAPCDFNVEYNYPVEQVGDAEYHSNWELNRHPAWHVFDMLTGNACVSKVPLENIDVDSFKHWAEVYPNWLVDVAIDGEYTRLECIRNMCSAAKANLTIINGKYTIVLDEPGKIPVAAISPRNSFNFSFEKTFTKDLHGFKVNYIEPDRDWTQQQVIVYAPGYDQTNATEFEVIDSYGCTDRLMAWRFGKFMLAQYRLRPETYILSQDIENLAVNIGDVVRLSHDIIKVGYGSARIKEVYLNEDGRATGVWVDDKFYIPEGVTYAMTVRDPLGSFKTYALQPNEDEEDVLIFPTPLPKDTMPVAGSMIWIGETDRAFVDVVVKSISPSDDLTATLTLVPLADEIHDESSADVPAWDPIITDTPVTNKKHPLAPRILSVKADESVLFQDITGGWKSAIAVTVAPQPEDNSNIAQIQVFYKALNAIVEYKQSFPYTGNDTCVLNHVSDGRTYEVKVRYVSAEGYVSPASLAQITVEGQLNPPPNVENLDRQGYNITWNYDNKPKDFDGFRIYYNYGYDTNFGYAVKAHTESVWDSPPFTTATLPKGPLTLFVVAVDKAGNESEVPAFISFYNGDTEFDNVLQVTDHIENLGEITDGYEFDGGIYANEVGSFYQADGTLFYDEDSELFYGRTQYQPMVYEFDIEYIGDVEDAYAKLDFDMEGIYKIWYKRESRLPFYKDAYSVFYDRYSFEKEADKTIVVSPEGKVLGHVKVSPTLAYSSTGKYLGLILEDEIIDENGALVGYVSDYPDLSVIPSEQVIYDISGALLGYTQEGKCYDTDGFVFGNVEADGLIKNSYNEVTGFWGYPIFELAEGQGTLKGFVIVNSTDAYNFEGEFIGSWNKDVESESYNFFYPQGEYWYLFPDKLLINNERIHVRIIFEAGTSQGIIKKLKSVIDAPDTQELISQVKISPEGTRLPIEKRYKVINKVFLTLQGQGDVANCRVLDYNLAGPLVKVYNASGETISAVVDADVRGYK